MKEEKPKEAKVVSFDEYTKKLKEQHRKKLLKQILDRGKSF